MFASDNFMLESKPDSCQATSQLIESNYDTVSYTHLLFFLFVHLYVLSVKLKKQLSLNINKNIIFNKN